MAEADSEEGHIALRHGLSNGHLFVGEPGVGILLEDIHRPAHADQRVVAVEWRNRLALVKLDRVPGDSVGAHEVAENAGMLDVDVLKHEELHRRSLQGARLSRRIRCRLRWDGGSESIEHQSTAEHGREADVQRNEGRKRRTDHRRAGVDPPGPGYEQRRAVAERLESEWEGHAQEKSDGPEQRERDRKPRRRRPPLCGLEDPGQEPEIGPADDDDPGCGEYDRWTAAGQASEALRGTGAKTGEDQKAGKHHRDGVERMPGERPRSAA